MANDVTTTPMVIDSVAVVLNNNGGTEIHAKELVWVGGAGGTLDLSINGGPTITFEGAAAGDYGPLHHEEIGYMKSLEVEAITGQLLIFA